MESTECTRLLYEVPTCHWNPLRISTAGCCHFLSASSYVCMCAWPLFFFSWLMVFKQRNSLTEELQFRALNLRRLASDVSLTWSP